MLTPPSIIDTEDKALTIYKASAGAGKTFTLAATYIAHLLSGNDDYPHKHQLAVTFTNKATAEMKKRILQYLYSMAYGNDDNDGFFKEVRKNVPEHITNEKMRALARQELLSIIHDYDHFHVTTIDSFFQSLLSALAHELNLSASFKAEVSDKDVLTKAVDRFIANLKEGSDELKWITEFVRERMNEDKDWNIAQELKGLASQITKESYMLNSHLLNRNENTQQADAIKLDNKTLQAYKKTLRELRDSQRQLVADKAAALNQAIEDGLTYANITAGNKNVKGCVENCMRLTTDRSLKLADINMSATMRGHADGSKPLLKKGDQKNPEFCAQAEALIPLFDALVQQYDASVGIVNSCDLSLANLNPLRLLDAIDKEVQALNRENDRMLLAYTPLLFHNLSKDTDASFVFERAGTRFNHIMIDEFQDTSSLQWNNMRQLLIENMAQGNSCMLVGDVKQGIYRFRGGDWNTLAGFNKGYSHDLHSYINIKTLKTNFRSGLEIVNFNNALFSRAPRVFQSRIEQLWKDAGVPITSTTPTLDIERIYPTPDENDDTHEVTQLPHDEGGYVRIHLINNTPDGNKRSRKADGEQEEKEEFCREAAVAEQMMRLNSLGVPFREMAVLIRDKKDAQPLIDYFEEHHGAGSSCPISLMSEEAFLLESSPAVMTLVNALRYISNKSDSIALEYLRRKCPAGKSMADIEAILNRWNADHYSGLPFYEITCRLADIFELHAMKGQSPYIYSFLDSILSYIEDHSADVGAFLTFWDEVLHSKTIPSAAANGVLILTIHKSKGLAFHTLFLPYCDWTIEKPGKSELIWARPNEAPFNALPILPITMSKAAGNSIYSDLYKQESFDRYVENLNVLYVAFTRPQQNMFVWANCKRGIGSLLRDSLNTTEEILEYGTPSTLKIKKDEGEEKQQKPSAQQQTPSLKDKATTNPLEYIPSPIRLEFAVGTPKIKFHQSNKAQEFLLPLMEAAKEEAEVAEALQSGAETLESGAKTIEAETAEATAEAIEAETAESLARAAAQEEYRMTGILLHNLMSTIESTADVDRKIDEAARQGLLPPSLSAEKVCKLIAKRISHPTAKRWFDGSWRLYRECTLLYSKNGKSASCRPDRVMMRGNIADGTDETIVIDFKFGRFKPEHRTQVQRYMQLLNDQGCHNVSGYLWYLYTGSIEPVQHHTGPADELWS